MSNRPQAIPESHLLYSVASQNLLWKDALGEWIDNAFDANAATVAIEFGKDYLTVSDNGSGTADLEAFATLGSSRRHSTTKLGRYGIGSKDGALWAGGVESSLNVTSVHGRQCRMLVIRWMDMAKDSWRHDPVLSRPSTPGEVGTVITVSPIVRNIPHGAEWDDLVTEIGYLYSPAIKRGRQITMRAKKKGATPTPVPRWAMPGFEGETIDRTVSVDGKTARVFCGLVQDGAPNPRRGLTYTHGFRVVIPSSQRGCGDFNISRVCGFVDLDDRWTLTKNKNGISKGERELFDEVQAACLPILKRAEAIGMAMESAAFEARASRALNESMAAATEKAKRKSPNNSTGTVRPTQSGIRHKKARDRQPGETMPGPMVGPGLKIVHSSLGEDKGVGEFQSPNVYLNTDNASVAQAYREQNVLATVMVASSLISADYVMTGADKNRGVVKNQLSLRGVLASANDTKAFSMAMGSILSGVSVDGRPTLKAIAGGK